MLQKYLINDLRRNKVIMIILFIFIMLAAMLASSATNVVLELTGSMHTLFTRAAVPHFVQMYTGELDQKMIDSFSKETELIQQQQTTTLLNIRGADIFLGNETVTQANSVLENSFVVQNKSFDFLLGQNNEVLQVDQGEIGVPVYYMKQNHLKIGDSITIANGDFQMVFIIKDFIRDAQMNPSLVTSKRFLIHEKDWNILAQHLGEKEYLIEFLLTDGAKINAFTRLYQSSNLPQTGTVVTYTLYQLLNALSDGVIAAIIILICVMLLLISFISLRFILLSAIEEEYQEIGTMKAIGIAHNQIRTLYLSKYLFLSGFACLCGYGLSLLLKNTFTQNIALYMGKAEQTTTHWILPVLGALLVFILVCCFCSIILQKLQNISVVEAFRNGNANKGTNRLHKMSLYQNKRINVNLFLGWNALYIKLHTYGLLCFVFMICTFLLIVPINFLTTIQSPAFITYMGAGESDIRIDLNQTKNMHDDYTAILEQIKKDPDITTYASFATSLYQIQNAEGELENIKIETGNFDIFPLTYISGYAPQNTHQIALSSMHAQELNAQIGSMVTILSDTQAYQLEVCGIYQDITNGGKTAKAMLPYAREDVLWYVVNFNIEHNINLHEKIQQYTTVFPSAKVTDMAGYMNQTFGSVIAGLYMVSNLSVILTIMIAVLITALFFKMLILKEQIEIATLYSMGFSVKDIKLQYITRALSVLVVGILIGLICSLTMGSVIVGMVLPGISKLHFIINPYIIYLGCPLLLLFSVGIAIKTSTRAIEKIEVMTIQKGR